MVELSRRERFELIRRFAGRLRFPQLFFLLLALFLLDLLVPDPIPFLDEMFLGVATAVLAGWKKRKQPAPDSAEEVTPESS